MASLIRTLSLGLVVIAVSLHTAAGANLNTTTHSTPPPSPCEDCLCYEDTCIDVGYDYCHSNQCSNCSADHCCCCDKEIEICNDKPCNCIDPYHICSDLDMDYCHPSECEGQCQGAQCCCTKEDQCPVWSECHCMVQKCSEVANLHDCDRCCNDCQFGHCCCCDKDDSVCPKDRECHCQGRSCDEIPGYGYCDPSKCSMVSDSSPNSFIDRYWANYVCPSDQCCCKMDTGTCADGLSCTCEYYTCWELGYDYCDCKDVPGCKPGHCCCPRQVNQCSYNKHCQCLWPTAFQPQVTCELRDQEYCDPATCGPLCPPERCCCYPWKFIKESPAHIEAVNCVTCRCGDCFNENVPYCPLNKGRCPRGQFMCCYSGTSINNYTPAAGNCNGNIDCKEAPDGKICADFNLAYCNPKYCPGDSGPQCCCRNNNNI